MGWNTVVGALMFNAQFTKTVTLTPAQIKSLISSPTLLVAGKANQIISLLSCFLLFNPGGTPFGTLVVGDAISPVIGTGTNAILSNDTLGVIATGFIDQTVPMGTWLNPFWTNTDTPTPTALKGASMFLTQFNQNLGFPNGLDWTTGNGTLTIFIRYSFIGD